MLQLHYPEVTAGIYIINTPTIFNILWRCALPSEKATTVSEFWSCSCRPAAACAKLHLPVCNCRGDQCPLTACALRVVSRMVKPWLHPKTQSYITLIGTSVAQQHTAFAAAGIEKKDLPHWAGCAHLATAGARVQPSATACLPLIGCPWLAVASSIQPCVHCIASGWSTVSMRQQRCCCCMLLPHAACCMLLLLLLLLLLLWRSSPRFHFGCAVLTFRFQRPFCLWPVRFVCGKGAVLPASLKAEAAEQAAGAHPTWPNSSL